MSDQFHGFYVESGDTLRLMTAGKYCDKDIYVSGTGGVENLDEVLAEQRELISDIKTALNGKAAGGTVDTSGLTANADHVLMGETFIGANGELEEGTMPQAEDVTIVLAPSKTRYQIPEGYHSGNGSVTVDYDQLLVTPSKDRQSFGNVNGSFIGAVTVEPIPDEYIIPSGTKKIEDNGTHDVTGYASVNVDVPPPDGYVEVSGTLEITANGPYVVETYQFVNVNVPTENQLDAALDGSVKSINSNVKSIIAYGCRGWSKLKTVNLPEATSIGTYAFYYCTAMTSFNAPKVTSLGTYAFYNSAVKTVNFPVATGLAQNVFYSCGSLAKADFGVASKINQAAFAYCESLVALILRKSDSICTLAVATNGFQGSAIANGTGYIYVPAALIETYKTATNWVNYASQFRAIEDYPDICG